MWIGASFATGGVVLIVVVAAVFWMIRMLPALG
jgi:CHASE3 domain sensor protein